MTEQSEQAGRRAEVRNLAKELVEKIPGQLFRDVSRFHEKFGLVPEAEEDHRLPEDVSAFRLKFLFEELKEYSEAVGQKMVFSRTGELIGTGSSEIFNAEKAFDALIDLVYVALGTAYLHGFSFNEGWERVQAANMAKVRCDGADDPRSLRKHRIDVVKPVGWKPPDLSDLV